MKKSFYIVCLSTILMLFGCQNMDSIKDAQAQTDAKKELEKIVIMAIDDTASYGLWNEAKNSACQIINQLKPGDLFYLRKITDESYTDGSFLFRLELPKMPESNYDNPFDQKAKKLKKLFGYRVLTLKAEAMKRISAMKPSQAGQTDIFGFLSIASEKLQIANDKSKRIICIASDMQENVGYKSEIDLSGAYIAIVGFQPMKDPKKTQSFKQDWIKTFKKAGAVQTVFIRADETIDLDKL